MSFETDPKTAYTSLNDSTWKMLADNFPDENIEKLQAKTWNEIDKKAISTVVGLLEKLKYVTNLNDNPKL